MQFYFFRVHRLSFSGPSGFTIPELLVVMGLVAVGFIAFISLFNPDQFLKEARDRRRIEDMAALADALNRFVDLGSPGVSMGASGSVYGSIPAAVVGSDGVRYPVQSTSQNPALTNALGWIPVKLDLVQTKQFTDLPRDPRNLDQYVYTYVTDGHRGYKLTTAFESAKYREQMRRDCGSNPDRYEVGSICTLQP